MSKDVISIKSNGLRNELKEIKKSIDNLTNAMIQIMAQTHTQNEKNNCNNCVCGKHDGLQHTSERFDTSTEIEV